MSFFCVVSSLWLCKSCVERACLVLLRYSHDGWFPNRWRNQETQQQQLQQVGNMHDVLFTRTWSLRDCWRVRNHAAEKDSNGALRKWRIKAGKAMFALKTTIGEEMLKQKHIWDDKTPKEAWDTFMILFSKKNDTRLQLLDNELLSISQRDMTIAQYFHKVKLICREITKLDPKSAIVESRMKRIIINGLRPEYWSFIIAAQGWPTQPSLVEFENLLTSQEAMAKQIGDITLKGEEEALYTSESRSNNRPSTKRGYNGDKRRSHQGIAQPGRTQKIDNQSSQGKDLRAFATIARRRATCPEIVGLRKNLSKAMWHPQTWRWRNEMQRYYMP